MQREEKMNDLKPGFFRKQDSDYPKSMKSMWVQKLSLDTSLLSSAISRQHPNKQLAPARACLRFSSYTAPLSSKSPGRTS